MNPAINWNADKVAEWLGYGSVKAFLAARPRLEAEGFPRPIPCGRLMWSTLSLSAWQASLVPAAQRKALAEAGGLPSGLLPHTSSREGREGHASAGASFDFEALLSERMDRTVENLQVANDG